MCGGIDPFLIPKSQLSENYDQLPNIEYLNISQYLVEGTSFYTGEAFKAYKSLDAHRLYKGGWIQKMSLKNIEGDKTIIIGKVR